MIDVYEDTRDDLLRCHPWNFATKRVKLARLTDAPVFGFEYAYSLPTDWLRTVSVHDNDDGRGTVEFKEETQNNKNVLVTDAEDVYLRYVARIEDPNRMPADFRKALSWQLAAAMAVDLSASNTIEDKVASEAEALVRRAKGSDAMGSTPERRPMGSWAGARYSGFSTSRWPK